MKNTDIIFIDNIDAFGKIPEFTADTTKVIFVDQNTGKYCLPLIKEFLNGKLLIITLPDKESEKNIYTCIETWEKLFDHPEIDRNSLVINLGGGIITDTGGFIASTYQRGLNVINIPTTLLGMVDAAAGGKTGVNFKNHKNQIGTFYQPEKIIISPGFLKTLDKTIIKSGYAEVIKYALIRDKNLWRSILKFNPDSDFENINIIKKCIRIKLFYSKKDFYEKNIRKALNFGHTAGHAFETFYMENKNSFLLHGYAVANGMIVESLISSKQLGLSSKSLNGIINLIKSYFSKLAFSKNDIPELINIMSKDKKRNQAAINFSLLKEIGDCRINVNVDEKVLFETMEEYLSI